ncbi:LLM class flavin-dependent oxidoreductase [Actinoplanes sp. URMC 104]|uniref:LLM class flavin-dependent oxidoreductase n=1 Tax=Actinoplanes sp. URMC 104 TaxID=3423409 RepID=UPI003F1C1A94
MTHLHLAVALDGAGWHPGAWREPDARPAELFTARYWADLVTEAEAGKLDFVTIEDALGVQSDDPTQVQGRLDAVLIAARVAPLTRHIGLVPTATVTHTEPFHISKAIATLDYVSKGRAGWRVQVSARPQEAAHFGRRTVRIDTTEAVSDLFDEAADYVEVVRRLWDSWEDDAEIRDAATGRFIDRDKLHYINFEGRFFTVKGPSITPRPPQGQPVVTALAHAEIPYRFAERAADIVYVTPADAADARRIVDQVKVKHVFADLVVSFRPAELESDAKVVTGTPGQLADLLQEWQAAGLTGFRLRPARLPSDLHGITRGLVPELQARGLFRTEYEPGTLRDRLGLERPANRYAEGARVA